MPLLPQRGLPAAEAHKLNEELNRIIQEKTGRLYQGEAPDDKLFRKYGNSTLVTLFPNYGDDTEEEQAEKE